MKHLVPDKAKMLFTVLLAAVFVFIIFPLAACSRHAVPGGVTNEPATEAPSEGPTEEADPTPDINGKRVIGMENDFYSLPALPYPGAVFLTNAIKEAINNPANTDALFNVSIGFYCLADAYEQEQWNRYYGPIAEDPVYLKYEAVYNDWSSSGAAARLAREQGIDISNTEAQAVLFADHSGLVDAEDRDRFIELQIALKDAAVRYQNAVREEALAPILREKLEKEILRLTRNGIILADPTVSFGAREAGVRALLTLEQARDFPGDPEIGYLIRFINDLSGFDLAGCR